MTLPNNGRRALALRDPIPWPDLLEIVRTAEQTGYSALFLPEVGARETPATLSALGASTEEIGLATGVIALTSRDPRTIAMAAATVQELSDGRFVLGLGAGRGPTLEEVRSTIVSVRALLAGQSVALDGEVPRSLGLVPASPPPIWLAALGPRMTELAGEVADGALLNWCTPERVASARGELRIGAERAGRDPASITIGVYVRACVGMDESVALDSLSQAAAMYAAMPEYARQFERLGLGEAASRAAAGDGEQLARQLCAWGTRKDAESRLAEYEEAGADVVVVYPVGVQGRAASLFGTVLGLAPSPSLEH